MIQPVYFYRTVEGHPIWITSSSYAQPCLCISRPCHNLLDILRPSPATAAKQTGSCFIPLAGTLPERLGTARTVPCLGNRVIFLPQIGIHHHGFICMTAYFVDERWNVLRQSTINTYSSHLLMLIQPFGALSGGLPISVRGLNQLQRFIFA